MKTIVIEGRDYTVDEAVAGYCDQLRSQLDACGAQARMRDADIASRDGKIAGLESEVSSLRVIADSSKGFLSPDAVAAEVRARLELISDARSLLDEKALEALVTKDSIEGKIEVLKAFSPERTTLIDSYRSKDPAVFRAFVDGMYTAARQSLSDSGLSQGVARGQKQAPAPQPGIKIGDLDSDAVTRIYGSRHDEFRKSLRKSQGGA